MCLCVPVIVCQEAVNSNDKCGHVEVADARVFTGIL